MDGYPDHLAPEFEEAGAVKTAFEEWWSRMHNEFPTMPEEVARYWLHEHWGHSPYGHLPSNQYKFERVEWQSSELGNIRSRWCNFDAANADCRAHGKRLDNLASEPYRYPTAIYMQQYRSFPTPIIVMDNRDAHLTPPNVPDDSNAIPAGYILIEGHRRFNLALHLHDTGRLNATVPVWLMTPVSSYTLIGCG